MTTQKTPTRKTTTWNIGKSKQDGEVSILLGSRHEPAVTLMFGVEGTGKSYRIQSLLKELNKDYANVEIVLSVPKDEGYEKETFIKTIVNDMQETRTELDKLFSELWQRRRNSAAGAPLPDKKLVFILDGNKLPTTDHGPESEVHDILSVIAKVVSLSDINAHLIISRRTITPADKALFDSILEYKPNVIVLGEPTKAVAEYFNIQEGDVPSGTGSGLVMSGKICARFYGL